MTPYSVGHARWFSHVNAVNPTRRMRGWLTDTESLTQKLIAHSTHFRVRRLRQERGFCLADERAMIELPRRAHVQEREVLLEDSSAHSSGWAFPNTKQSATREEYAAEESLCRSTATTRSGWVAQSRS